NGPYDFSIDNGANYVVIDDPDNDHTFTNLIAGTYNLRVRDANDCESAPIAITIDEPAVVGGNTSKTDVLCFGESTGTITISGTGGVAPYDFSIDNGANYTIVDDPDN